MGVGMNSVGDSLRTRVTQYEKDVAYLRLASRKFKSAACMDGLHEQCHLCSCCFCHELAARAIQYLK